MKHLRTHLRVVSALIIREFSTRYGRKPGGYIWAFLEPISYILLLSAIFSAIARTPALGTSYALFFATGRMGYGFFKSVSDYVGGAIRSNVSLLRYPLVAPFDAAIARLVLQVVTSILIEGVITIGIFLTLKTTGPVNCGLLALTSLICGALGLGFGLINAALFIHFPLYEQIYKIVTRPLIMISGVFYLPDAMPHPTQEILLYNPLCHVAILVRMAFYPEYRGIGLDLEYLTICASISLLVGMAVFTWRRRSLRSERQ
ncbi:ABC transporter permease [Rhizobium sullae]|uniref:Transport permease protein n=1 Tax=Rhizobium sullae TaxID=50338 RepID=A0A4V2V8V3_RHISU|nr:ABC transporter permease [Rhizobium sullae]TCU14705.1 capsular polysaccharide transport system permease protein [Rhizobium sullae]